MTEFIVHLCWKSRLFDRLVLEQAHEIPWKAEGDVEILASKNWLDVYSQCMINFHSIPMHEDIFFWHKETSPSIVFLDRVLGHLSTLSWEIAIM